MLTIDASKAPHKRSSTTTSAPANPAPEPAWDRQDDWARFSSKLTFIRNDRLDTPCCVWTASCDQKGYGHFTYGGQTRRAHTVAMEWFLGHALPAGMQVHHIAACGRKNCVNIQHLKLVTTAEHFRLHRAPVCKHGHERNAANSYEYVHKDGFPRRKCKPCRREWQRRNKDILTDRRRQRKQSDAAAERRSA